MLGHDTVWRDLVDLATLGTIADIVPLTGENRAIVAEGLAMMRRAPKVGIASLAVVAGTSIEVLDAQAVAFGLAPRLNAAGRMADPAVSLDLLLTDDPADAEVLAQSLDELNRLRQTVEQDLTEAGCPKVNLQVRTSNTAVIAFYEHLGFSDDHVIGLGKWL